MAAYYNEFDPGAAAWLRELIKRGLIADGEVDERSILDVGAGELSGFTQCHFFAGIGGWSRALRLAGWPDDRPVWTGSPPCQPFSSAGKQLGRDDARHLAPHFIGLVRAARPAVLFGEQVASADVFGKAAGKPGKGPASPPQWAWLDDLSDRLEAARYAIGASDIPAASIGAPHIRQRTFFGAIRLADADAGGKGVVGEGDCGLDGRGAGIARAGHWTGSADGRLADADHAGPQGRVGMPERADQCAAGAGSLESGLADASGGGRGEERQDCRGGAGGDRTEGRTAGHGAGCSDSGLADATGERWDGRQDPAGADGGTCPETGGAAFRTSPPNSFWASADWLYCRDAKWRPTQPGLKPLVDGLPRGMGRGGDDGSPFHPAEARVMRLRGYGNAIVPQAAAIFIQSFTDAIQGNIR